MQNKMGSFSQEHWKEKKIINPTLYEEECRPKDEFKMKLKFYTSPKPLAKKGKVPAEDFEGFSSTSYSQIKDSESMQSSSW